MFLRRFLVSALFAVTAASAGAAAPLPVWVTILPQQYVVERIGGERVAVEVLVAPGRSPATYSPTVRQMVRLAKGRVYFAIGVPVEHAVVPRIEASMPGLKLVRLEEAEAEGADPSHDHHDHDHGHACGSDDRDPHVWLDPARVVEHAERIRAVLTQLDPEGAETYAAGAAAFTGELRALDAELRVRMAPYEGRAFFINHPSLGHFAAAYGLRQMAVEEGGDAPGPRRMAGLMAAARIEGVRAVLSQPQFEGSSVEVLARALDVGVIEVDPLAEDYFECLRAIADAMEAAFAAL